MSLFTKAENHMAYLKAGLMGQAGSGKTYTGTEIACGLFDHMRERQIDLATKPVFFIDTETGSDWVIPKFKERDIELFTAKTRAFKDLIEAVREAEANGAMLLIDSITHFWQDVVDSYMSRKRVTRLEFNDWNVIKPQWREFTDLFVNSNLHIIMCGRQGYEYEYQERDDNSGKKDLIKTGTKMKAEGDTGYEPSILIEMERLQDVGRHKTWRVAHILKDRSGKIDGKSFSNPTFNDFLPHIEYLNIGGSHEGVDTTRNSEDMFDSNGKPQWLRDKEEKEIVLDEVTELLKKHYPSKKESDIKARGELLEKHFDTRSWKRIESPQYNLLRVKQCYNSLHLELDGEPAYPEPDAPEDLSEQEDQLAAL